jgi:circadian clock protein KaiC
VLDDKTSTDHDLQVQSIAHGVIQLEQLNPDYGAERRRLRISKFRGSRFRGGYHDFIIQEGGLVVFPRLVAREHRPAMELTKLPSGIGDLDELLGGGIERGTSTLISGAAGTGKSTLAAQFIWAACERGERCSMFMFDEGMATLLTRSAGLGMDLQKHLDSGALLLQQVDPAELSPGELTNAVRESVEIRGSVIVVIDSLNGYLNAMPGERFLIVQLHEMLSYLGQAGVATLLINAHHGLIGATMTSPVDASYLADAVILMRYFELEGEVRQAISVLKKRGGEHERSIREFRLGSGTITLGPPLRNYRGILTGVPVELEPREPGIIP